MALAFSACARDCSLSGFVEIHHRGAQAAPTNNVKMATARNLFTHLL